MERNLHLLKSPYLFSQIEMPLEDRLFGFLNGFGSIDSLHLLSSLVPY